MIFKATDIQWIKNVKNKTSNDHLSYMDGDEDGIFTLHWSNRFTTDTEAKKAQIGDIIVMYQRQKHTLLTHLVTPIDDEVIDCRHDNSDFPWGRNVRILAQASEGISLSDKIDLSSVNQNHIYGIDKVKLKSDINIQEVIWEAFLPSMNNNDREISANNK